jgi:hypothetical protein
MEPGASQCRTSFNVGLPCIVLASFSNWTILSSDCLPTCFERDQPANRSSEILKDFEKDMDIQPHVQLLHSQLLELSKLSQRAVEYSIKAYELSGSEFCLNVRSDEHELDGLNRGIADIGRKFQVAGLPVDSDSRFVWCASLICRALHTTYTAATDIAQNNMLFLEDGGIPESSALDEMGQLANRLVRQIVLSPDRCFCAGEIQ